MRKSKSGTVAWEIFTVSSLSHFEEVTGLCLPGDLLVSKSIDTTVGKWSLAPQVLQRAVEELKKPKDAELDEVRPKMMLALEC